MDERYYSFNRYLKERFGTRVARIPVNLNLGCPNRDGRISTGGCIYCDHTGSGVADASLPIEEQVKVGIQRIGRRYKTEKFMVYFQAFSNTYAPPEKLKELYNRALIDERIVGIIIGTRPDLVCDEILKLIASYKEKYEVWIEYGLQSCHYQTLKLINRGHGPSSFINAVLKSKEKGIKVGCHVILGLPGEDKEDMMETARFISALPVDGIKIHLLHVLRGTALERMHREGKIKLFSMEEYVETVVEFLEHLREDIVVQRLTGEAPPDRLVAPLWCLRKAEVIQKIREKLKEKNTRQGTKLRFYISFKNSSSGMGL